mmetsp:Transcript_4241/g.9236  ORF Transcript_4241/g.9236 Transcript_4241/m.9236 type:complete len:313 (+) Transcript_4241:293-1231(+)
MAREHIGHLLAAAIIASACLSTVLAQTVPVGPVSGPFQVSGAKVRIQKVSGPGEMDSWWYEAITWCTGQVLFNVTNMGDSTVNRLEGPLVLVPPPMGSVLTAPRSYLYNTGAGEGMTLHDNTLTITDIGYYMAGRGGSSMFAITVKCNNTCPCAGLPNLWQAGSNTNSGSTSDTCVNNGGTMAIDGNCISIVRDMAPANPNDMDNQWGDSRICMGQVRYRINNRGQAPFESIKGNPVLTANLANGLVLINPMEYLYTTTAIINATTIPFREAGYFTAPNSYSVFSLTLGCYQQCPCNLVSSVNFAITPFAGK